MREGSSVARIAAPTWKRVAIPGALTWKSVAIFGEQGLPHAATRVWIVAMTAVSARPLAGACAAIVQVTGAISEANAGKAEVVLEVRTRLARWRLRPSTARSVGTEPASVPIRGERREGKLVQNARQRVRSGRVSARPRATRKRSCAPQSGRLERRGAASSVHAASGQTVRHDRGRCARVPTVPRANVHHARSDRVLGVSVALAAENVSAS